MEPIHRLSFTVGPLHLDRFGRCKASVLLSFAQEAAEAHSMILSAGWDTLHQKGLFWAVIRQKLQVSRLPQLGETITVETWPMPTTRVAYPRSTVAYDEAGNEVFRAISLWVLMDESSRMMILPGKSGIAVQGTLRGNELPPPGSLSVKNLERVYQRPVCFSDLDRNGHMNNTRYLDWVMDLLPSSFHRDHPLREVTLCYLSEAREGEQLYLSWDMQEGPILTVEANRKEQEQDIKKQHIFSSQVRF